MGFNEIVNDHPELEKEDLVIALEFARKTVSGSALSSFA